VSGKLTPKQTEGLRLLQHHDHGSVEKGGALALTTARALQAQGLCTVTGDPWTATLTEAGRRAVVVETPATKAPPLPPAEDRTLGLFAEETASLEAPAPPAAPPMIYCPPAGLLVWGPIYVAAMGRWVRRLATEALLTLDAFAEDVRAVTAERLGAEAALAGQDLGTLVRIADVGIAAGWITPKGDRGARWEDTASVDFTVSVAPTASKAPTKAKKVRAVKEPAPAPESPAPPSVLSAPPSVLSAPPAALVAPQRPRPAPKAPPPTDYVEFLKSKAWTSPVAGFEVAESEIHPGLFPYQRDIVRWALRRGRAGIFASTGLGKTRMALEIARHVAARTGKPILILTPLAVAPQFVREAVPLGIPAQHIRSQSEVSSPVVMCNYEKLHKLTPAAFGGVLLDEASILRDFSGKTKQQLIEAFSDTPYRFTATATPAPNDHEELGNQAEFLGVMTRTEMLASFFCHDGGNTSQWRLKGHAKTEFWRWMAGWSVLLRLPSDLGYDDAAHLLPPLWMHHHVVESDDAQAREMGLLFAVEARTLGEQRKARRSSLSRRVEKTAALVAEHPDAPWLLWGDLNDECDELEKAIPGAVQIAGRHTEDQKEERMMDFVEGRTRVIVTKASIFGLGLNLQHCSRMVFVGLDHSFEKLFQAIRRCYRFGQKNPVDVHIVLSEAERSVLRNIQRKEAEAEKMAIGMAQAMGEIQRANVRGIVRETESYQPAVPMIVPAWLTSKKSEAAE
jgi:hypothetical protein